MIEKGPAVDHLDEILEIDGIDMIQWGPADYSVNVGKIGQREAVKSVERVVIDKSLAAGRNPRAEINTADEAGTTSISACAISASGRTCTFCTVTGGVKATICARRWTLVGPAETM